MYQPVVNAKTKKEIFPGLAYGSELGWATFESPQPFGIGAQMFQYMVFNDPNWDYKTLNFDEHMALVDKAEAGLINARDPNLSKFVSRGGKLIQYHGWSDPNIVPFNSINYYRSALEVTKAPDSMRLFMVPGMGHCGGGNGTSTFDMVPALDAWVEHGRAPARINASRVRDGKVDRTRPLCAYPKYARYTGTGSMDDAANFRCTVP